MKIGKQGMGVIIAVGLLGLATLWATAQTEEFGRISRRPKPMPSLPPTGTFFSLQISNQPPLPFNPFPDLPVYEIGKGIYGFDDRSVDYAKLRAEADAVAALEKAKQELDGEANEKENGSGMSLLENAVEGLFLRGPVVNGTSLQLQIEGADTNSFYDLYWNSELSTNVPWTQVARTDPGVTNITIVGNTSATAFFRLGTLVDSDGDEIPDAYEALATGTDPAVANTASSLGTNSWLLDEVSPSLRVYSANQVYDLKETWSPCPTNPPAEDHFQIHQWHRDTNGIVSGTFHRETCVNGQVVVLDGGETHPWNGSAAEKAKFAWHLEGISGATNLTTLDSSWETRVEWLTGGKPLSAKSWPWIIKASATNLIPTWSGPFELTNSIPATAINVSGKTLDTNGEAVVVWRDNSTNDCTPTITGPSNYMYGVNAEKVIVPLAFRNSGQLTQRETNIPGVGVVGYKATAYDWVTNYLKTTTLGTENPPSVTPSLHFNFQETDATVPTNAFFNSGWEWHRDVVSTYYLYGVLSGATNGTMLTEPGKSFSTGTAGEGGGNDQSGIADADPDASRLILDADLPGIGLQVPPPAGYDSVIAQRMYARQWVKWNGVRVSDILRWRSFVTVRKLNGGTWERKGQNLIELTPIGDPEVPSFTEAEALPICLEP